MCKKLIFSGHESFHCRTLWLKKGVDFLLAGKSFTESNAIVDLGVGKNMVNSISYWLRSFGLVDKDNKLTRIADFIFGENGVDPYLENPATLWLLHYHLVKENIASIYSLVFNEFRKNRLEFNKNHLLNFLKIKCSERKCTFSDSTILRDITVFLRNYVKPTNVFKNLEDLSSGIFIELDLIEQLSFHEDSDLFWYIIENKERKDLPAEVLLYCILDNENYSYSITFDEILNGYNSIGSIFALTSNDIIKKFEFLEHTIGDISFKDDAGIKLLQFKEKPDKWEVLANYYEK